MRTVPAAFVVSGSPKGVASSSGVGSVRLLGLHLCCCLVADCRLGSGWSGERGGGAAGAGGVL